MTNKVDRQELLHDVIELRRKEVTYDEMIETLGIKYDTVFTKTQLRKMYSRHLKKMRKAIESGKVKHTMENNSVTSSTVIAMQEGDDKDEIYVLRAHGLDPTKWTITSMTNNFWQQNNTEHGLVNLYQSKIKVKPVVSVDYDIYVKNVKPVKIERKKVGERNLVIPLADKHFPISNMKTLKVYIDELVEVIENSYNVIVIELLGDMFHSNAMRKTQTIRGTELETVDMEFAIEEARRFFDVLVTTALKHSNEVRVEFAAGNHSDFDYMFLLYLEARYPQLIVNRHNQPRVAYKLGGVGIMLTHGHYGKKSDYPMLFATEFKEIWASCSWLEVHQGHKHTMEAQNINGVIHRQLGTLKANDIYEVDNGYTMNYKSTQAFEYSDDKLKVVYELG